MRGETGTRLRVRVELLYLEGCPHVETARRRLRGALRARGLPEVWLSWDLGGWVPDPIRGHPSPTILIDGEDVLQPSTRPSGAPACALDGAPPLDLIAAALERALAGRGASPETPEVA